MSTIKINWGTKIALFYGSFVVLIVTLVAGSMRQSFDLVAPDYYGQELKYQNVIDAGKNQAALSTAVAIHANEKSVIINFPAEFAGKAVSGTVHFYSPVSASWDKEFPVSMDNDAMIVSRTELRNTTYTMKINWQSAGKKYYQESELKLH